MRLSLKEESRGRKQRAGVRGRWARGGCSLGGVKGGSSCDFLRLRRLRTEPTDSAGSSGESCENWQKKKKKIFLETKGAPTM